MPLCSPRSPPLTTLHCTKVDVVEYPELGMEAVWMIDVVDFPAFIVVDDKGNDFFEQVGRPVDLAAKH